MKLSENFLRSSANELIIQCYTCKDLIQKVEMIRGAIYAESELHKDISLFKSRIKRLERDFLNGTILAEKYDTRFTKIQKSVIDTISDLQIKEVKCGFEYDDLHGFIYHIHSPSGEFMYRFIGEIQRGLPQGKGVARFHDGSYFEGSFKNGIENGHGTLFSKDMKVLKKGMWKNGNLIEQDTARYYKNIFIEADSRKSIDIIHETDFEILELPPNTGIDLVAFPLIGDSMSPTFAKGDTIICKEIMEKEDLINDKIYVVYHEEKLVLKIVQKCEGIPNTFRLISENFRKHHPYKINGNSKTKFYKLVMHLRKY